MCEIINIKCRDRRDSEEHDGAVNTLKEKFLRYELSFNLKTELQDVKKQQFMLQRCLMKLAC